MTGTYFMLQSNSGAWGASQVAWSDLAIYKGSSTSCVP